MSESERRLLEALDAAFELGGDFERAISIDEVNRVSNDFGALKVKMIGWLGELFDGARLDALERLADELDRAPMLGRGV